MEEDNWNGYRRCNTIRICFIREHLENICSWPDICSKNILLMHGRALSKIACVSSPVIKMICVVILHGNYRRKNEADHDAVRIGCKYISIPVLLAASDRWGSYTRTSWLLCANLADQTYLWRLCAIQTARDHSQDEIRPQDNDWQFWWLVWNIQLQEVMTDLIKQNFIERWSAKFAWLRHTSLNYWIRHPSSVH